MPDFVWTDDDGWRELILAAFGVTQLGRRSQDVDDAAESLPRTRLEQPGPQLRRRQVEVQVFHEDLLGLLPSRSGAGLRDDASAPSGANLLHAADVFDSQVSPDHGQEVNHPHLAQQADNVKAIFTLIDAWKWYTPIRFD